MGGCVSSQRVQEEPDESVWAEVCKAYERRIADCLPQDIVLSPRKSKTSCNDDVVSAPAEGELLTTPKQQHADDNRSCQTLFFVDLDDLLFSPVWTQQNCPLRGGCRFAPNQKEHKDRLREISVQVADLLSQAETMGKVVIVTNATRSCVATCCDKLMPEAKGIVGRIQRVHALDLLSASEMAALPDRVRYTEAKPRAVRTILSSFYRSKCEPDGAINVVSIGDWNFERIATREFARYELQGKGHSKRCLTKTIKIQGRQSPMHMSVQLTVIAKWFAQVVHAGSHVNIDLGKQA